MLGDYQIFVGCKEALCRPTKRNHQVVVGTWSSQRPIVAITRYAIGNCGSQDKGVR